MKKGNLRDNDLPFSGADAELIALLPTDRLITEGDGRGGPVRRPRAARARLIRIDRCADRQGTTRGTIVPPVIRTERLILRHWRDADGEPFAEMNADPLVMRHFPNVLSRVESDALAARIEDHFAGFVRLSVPGFQAPFTPCVEIGWRLAFAPWGRGYVTEAADAALAFAFGELRLTEVVSFTVPNNAASRRVMEKIGMTHDRTADFEHPLLPVGHPLRLHVLYRKRGAPSNQALQPDDTSIASLSR